jgi:protein prenyltransferase alpha subunit repeat containing protein 1
MRRASIEILPGGWQEWTAQAPDIHEGFPFVYKDGHLGVPLKVLYRIYLAALSLFNNAERSTALELSSVILLANPSHQTILNARKKFIQSHLLDPEKELRLTELLIRGSKECAKQSIVWDHRRWIFKFQYQTVRGAQAAAIRDFPGWSTSEEAAAFPMIPLATLKEECELTRQACELYPRNYHAWTYWHWVMNVARSLAYDQLMEDEVAAVRNWIDRHVSDYSAVHHLCNLANLIGRPQSSQAKTTTLTDDSREHALSLVREYPSHEALWLYLRNTLILSSPKGTHEILMALHSSPNYSYLQVDRWLEGL